jgi:segregation and condensation protein B
MEQNIQDTHNQYSASEKEVVHQPEPPHLAAIIESLLFVSGHPLEMVELRKILAINDELLAAALELLARDLAHARRGIRLQSMGTQVQLVTAPENARYVALLLGLPLTARLTTAALETLAVVAYRQPLTRSQIEAVRGVNSDRALTSLIQHGLVSEIGRAPTPGRPALFATTGDFLQQFGLTSLSELPGVTNRIAQRSDQGVSQDQQSVPAISQ